jgi:hypothetical protein
VNRRREAAVLLGILTAAVLLRAHHGGERTLWLDEFYSLQESGGWPSQQLNLPLETVVQAPLVTTRIEHARPARQIVAGIRTSSHPPVFFVVLRLWREVVGDREPLLRALPVAASLGAIVLLYLAVRASAGGGVGLWAAGLMAVMPTQVHYATEIRGYTLAMALVLACCVAIVRIERAGASRGSLAALAGGALLSMLTHYHAAGPLLGIAAYAALRLRGRERRAVAFTLLASAAVWATVWGASFLSQRDDFRSTARWQQHSRNNRAYAPGLALTELPARHLGLGSATEPPSLPASLVVDLVILWATRRRRLLLWGCVTAGNLALLSAVDVALQTRQLEIVRYSLMAGPGICALIAGAAASGFPRHLLPLMAAVVAGTRQEAPVQNDRPWAEYVDVVRRLAGPEPCLVVLHGTAAAPDTAILPVLHYLFPVSGWVMVSAAEPVRVDQVPAGVRRVLLVGDRRPGRGPASLMRDQAPAPSAVRTDRVRWPGMPTIESFEVPIAAPPVTGPTLPALRGPVPPATGSAPPRMPPPARPAPASPAGGASRRRGPAPTASPPSEAAPRSRAEAPGPGGAACSRGGSHSGRARRRTALAWTPG